MALFCKKNHLNLKHISSFCHRRRQHFRKAVNVALELFRGHKHAPLERPGLLGVQLQAQHGLLTEVRAVDQGLQMNLFRGRLHVRFSVRYHIRFRVRFDAEGGKQVSFLFVFAELCRQ
jgi:hypothetical protein